MMKLSLGFSPCPNDTFIFDALVNGKIDTEGLEFEVVLEDVQTLNEWAIAGKLDLTKISYGVLPHIVSQYLLLDSGGALGSGVGPLLISSTLVPDNKFEQMALVKNSQVAIPGKNTTANLLFTHAFPQNNSKVYMRFDEIEDWVLAGNGLGVIIHENRFTYALKGLYKVADLGTLWEQETGSMIPLGGIVGKRTLDLATLKKINRLITKSVAYGFDHYPTLPAYVKAHAQEMDEEVMKQHIDLYVNDYSLNLGDSGRQAIQTLFNHKDHSLMEKQLFLV